MKNKNALCHGSRVFLAKNHLKYSTLSSILGTLTFSVSSTCFFVMHTFCVTFSSFLTLLKFGFALKLGEFAGLFSSGKSNSYLAVSILLVQPIVAGCGPLSWMMNEVRNTI